MQLNAQLVVLYVIRYWVLMMTALLDATDNEHGQPTPNIERFRSIKS
jgi:hypothetical protein